MRGVSRDRRAADALRQAGVGRWQVTGDSIHFDPVARALMGSRRAAWPLSQWLATLEPAEARELGRALAPGGDADREPLFVRLSSPQGVLWMRGGHSRRQGLAGVVLAGPPEPEPPLLVGNARQEDRDALFVGISHELRTPLHAIHGFAQLARSDPSPQAGRQYLEPIEQSSRLMLRVVTDLLDLARLEAGRLEIEPEQPLSLPALVTRVCAQAVALRGNQPVRLYGTVDPRCPAHVRGDGLRLEQVLLNLVANALKFTPVGEVVVAVKLRGLRDGVATVALSVADTGIGIPAQHLDRLGVAFERGAASAQGRTGGTGLGLALVRRLLDLHGTRLRVASVSGGGTLMGFDLELPVDELAPREAAVADTVVFTADSRLHDCLATQWRAQGQGLRPIAQAARARRWVIDAAAPDALPRWAQAHAEGREALWVHAGPAPERCPEDADPCALTLAGHRVFADDTRLSAEADPALQGRSVLVVEDNALSQQVLLAFLGRLGLQARAVADGRSAREAVRLGRFDLVILDIQLPDTTGFECARALQTLPHGQSLPMLFLSAQVGPEEQLQAAAVGARACLSKPFESEGLRALLRQLLSTGAAAPLPTRVPPLVPPLAPLPAPSAGPAGPRVRASADHPAARVEGSPLAGSLRQLFVDQWRALRSAIDPAAKPEDCARAAHQLRASFALLQAPEGVAAARALEEALRHGQPPPPGALDTVRRTGDRLAGTAASC